MPLFRYTFNSSGAVSSVGRAALLHSEGRGFKPSTAHQTKKTPDVRPGFSLSGLKGGGGLEESEYIARSETSTIRATGQRVLSDSPTGEELRTGVKPSLVSIRFEPSTRYERSELVFDTKPSIR